MFRVAFEKHLSILQSLSPICVLILIVGAASGFSVLRFSPAHWFLLAVATITCTRTGNDDCLVTQGVSVRLEYSRILLPFSATRLTLKQSTQTHTRTAIELSLLSHIPSHFHLPSSRQSRRWKRRTESKTRQQ